MLPLEITVMWCVWPPCEILTELLLYCSFVCFCPFISLSARFFPHLMQSERWPRIWTDAERCVHVCLLLYKWGGRASSTHYRFGRWEAFFFMATSCWEKDFLWLQDIVSFKYEFYCWKGASREQRVGLIIPVFAVQASDGDHLSSIHSQRRDLLDHVEDSAPVTWETGHTNINKGT